MPRCEGRPDGTCPAAKNDGSVRLSQGDLMLCPECDRYQFPKVYRARATKQTSQPVRNGKEPLKTGAVACEGESPATTETMTTANAAVPVKTTSKVGPRVVLPNVIFSELLTYAHYHRNRATTDNIRKVIVHFYSNSEISTAKKT